MFQRSHTSFEAFKDYLFLKVFVANLAGGGHVSFVFFCLKCILSILGVFQRSFMGMSREFQRTFKGVEWKIQGYSKRASRFFLPGSFKVVSKKFQ